VTSEIHAIRVPRLSSPGSPRGRTRSSKSTRASGWSSTPRQMAPIADWRRGAAGTAWPRSTSQIDAATRL